jgi:hypothetical protein
VTQPIDATKLISLHGTVHPLAQARNDRGSVSESTPAERLLLLLNRPPEREAALQQALKDLHSPGSPSYHHWLTPQEIGEQYGPSDEDMEAVVGWLSSSGFTVSQVSKAKRFIEFSGTVGQVNNAFYTQIHEYMVNGVLHHANATEVRIPQALAGIVAALSPLNDFWPKPQLQSAGRGHYYAAARRFAPDFNLPSQWSPLLYGVAPADFYTQYDLGPLYGANVTGAGVTIGIIDESNIDVSLDNAYRSVFGLKVNPVQVILDGSDPGPASGEGESYLDVELAGAVAPGATIDLYLSGGSPYQDPLELAAVRAVEDNQADVLNISWGTGEAELELSGNQFWDALWEQAAAQGQTVLVSTGDFGQVPDENYLTDVNYAGPAVNGLASTPWNIAVGGTDFYYADYASGALSVSTFWNTTNDSTTKGSLKAPITEQVWNDPFGLDAVSNGLQRGEFGAGGGGASSCSKFNTSGGCAGGYPKPSWQTGPGVPADGVRDIPDVSLFASNGANFSGYVICDYEGECTPDTSGNFSFDVVGGTSASTPAMAGIMALVDQRYGRQGQADAVLYPLAQQKAAAFHDITLGGNWDICLQGDQDCTSGVAGLASSYGESTVYSAGPGYDQASGLGSVDASQLVNNWNTISFTSTSTSLHVTPTTAVHGTNVTVSTNVMPSSGTGTPTGAVSILTTSTLPSNESQTAVALNGGTGSATVNYMPGGTYKLSAQYGGDGTYAGSTSSPETLTVTPEASTLTLSVNAPNIQISGIMYGSPVNLSAQPVGVNSPKGSSDGVASGAIAFTLDGATTNVPLNVGGIASWGTPALSVGTHTASASYSGDASFNASSAQSQTLTVTQGAVNVNSYPSLPLGPVPVNQNISVPVGSSLTMSILISPYYIPASYNAPTGLAAPTGTVTLNLYTFTTAWELAYSQTVTLSSPAGISGTSSSALVTIPNLAAGNYNFDTAYSGDTNYQASPCPTPYACFAETWFISVASTAAQPAASVTNLTVTPSNLSSAQNAMVTATVTGPSGATVAPTGSVSFYDNGAPLAGAYYSEPLSPAADGVSASYTFYVAPDSFWSSGANQITAVYSGDSNYIGSTSNAAAISVTQTGADFAMTPQSPQLTAVSGGTASTAINLTSLYGFNGTIALTCAPSSSQFSCSISPSATSLNGTSTATLIVTATISGTTAKLSPAPGNRGWFGGASALALCLVLVWPLRRRRWIGMVCLPILLTVSLLAGCGGNGNAGGGGAIAARMAHLLAPIRCSSPARRTVSCTTQRLP